MRNFRTAAIASATALTVAFSGVAAAQAAEGSSAQKPETTTTTPMKPATPIGTPGQKKDKDQVVFAGEITKADGEKDKPLKDVLKDGFEGMFNGKGSSQFVNDSDKLFYGVDAFGKETNSENIPQWGRLWIDGTVIAAIGALVGLVIAGFNFASYNGLIKF